jgi:Flp pilus assembly protein TadG
MLKPITGKRRFGVTSILVAILITVLLGITAIAIDGGMLEDNKRRVQATADAAALAAASKLYKNYTTMLSTNTADPNGDGKAAALAVASENGFADDGTTVVVTVNIPPATGPFAGKFTYAEVTIVYSQPRYFSGVFGTNSTNVSARAVAVGAWKGSGKGVIVLDPTVADALDSNGNGSLSVTGGASVIVNSSDPSAARDTGGGTVTADNFLVTGGTNGTFNGTVTTGVPPSPDPLAYLPAPTEPPAGTMTTKNLGMGNKQYTLTPGSYSNLPSFQTGDVVIFQQASAGNNGIFYLNGGGFSSQGATITMDPTTTGGVMIYNNPTSNSNNQGINITGNASGLVNLSALQSGPYAGILFWQNRTATQTMSVTGNGQFSLTGTFYTADALLSVTGGGTATIGSQYISRTLGIGGGGGVTINYSDKGTARTRIIQLVE